MDVEKIREIPIADYLGRLGFHPVKGRGMALWYHAPYRSDRTPSFKLDTQKEKWFDFGMGEGGDIFTLAGTLIPSHDFIRQAQHIAETMKLPILETKVTEYQKMAEDTEPQFANVEVLPLGHLALRQYLSERAIPFDVAERYCKEVHYNVREHKYFALCFQNILGGMEIRNRFFKGGYGTKAPSVIHLSKEKRTKTCCLFEGFMDFLSYKVLRAQHNMKVTHPVPSDCIVLNSTSLVKKALPFLQVYEMVFSYLDNDVAGRQAAETIEASMPGKVMRISDLYSDYKDLNDYLMSIQGNN